MNSSQFPLCKPVELRTNTSGAPFRDVLDVTKPFNPKVGNTPNIRFVVESDLRDKRHLLNDSGILVLLRVRPEENEAKKLREYVCTVLNGNNLCWSTPDPEVAECAYSIGPNLSPHELDNLVSHHTENGVIVPVFSPRIGLMFRVRTVNIQDLEPTTNRVWCRRGNTKNYLHIGEIRLLLVLLPAFIRAVDRAVTQSVDLVTPLDLHNAPAVITEELRSLVADMAPAFGVRADAVSCSPQDNFTLTLYLENIHRNFTEFTINSCAARAALQNIHSLLYED